MIDSKHKINDFFRKNHSITLEQMKNFIHIYETGSLSQAAIIAHKTQPAISHNIRKLEEKLNTQLVKRNRGKTISFTEDGHKFYKQVTPIIGQLLTQIDEIENRNTISIGVCDDLSIETQLHMYQAVSEQTGYRVRLLCDFSYKIRQMVEAGQLSFAIVKKICCKPNSIQADEETGHAFTWVGNQTVHFDELEKVAIVSAHSGCLIRDLLEETLDNIGKDYYFSYLGNDLASQSQAIMAGFGIGILDNRWIQKYPALVRLNASQGYPALPSFYFDCIGEYDNHHKQKIQPILHGIVKRLNTV